VFKCDVILGASLAKPYKRTQPADTVMLPLVAPVISAEPNLPLPSDCKKRMTAGHASSKAKTIL
jgi:hypothetical protein